MKKEEILKRDKAREEKYMIIDEALVIYKGIKEKAELECRKIVNRAWGELEIIREKSCEECEKKIKGIENEK